MCVTARAQVMGSSHLLEYGRRREVISSWDTTVHHFPRLAHQKGVLVI